jgi:hypothetical protein
MFVPKSDTIDKKNVEAADRKDSRMIIFILQKLITRGYPSALLFYNQFIMRFLNKHTSQNEYLYIVFLLAKGRCI